MKQSITVIGKIVFCAVMAIVSVLSALMGAARNAANRPRDNTKQITMTKIQNSKQLAFDLI